MGAESNGSSAPKVAELPKDYVPCGLLGFFIDEHVKAAGPLDSAALVNGCAPHSGTVPRQLILKDNTMKIVGFEVEDWEQEAFKRIRGKHELLLTPKPVSESLDSRYKDADIISTFIYSNLSERTLDQFDKLKLIATRSTGFDHIDLEYCEKNNITICNVPEYGGNTVAEHAFALIHAISRHIPEAVQRTRNHSFSQEGLQGFDLQGKTIGIIGTGDIGRKAIRIATGYGMKVLAFDVKPDQEAAGRMGFEYTDMDTLLSTADIVTIHVPGIETTRDLISRREFEKMKQRVILINTARGFVVNVQALLQALAEGKVAAAGLDVLPEEPVIREEAELLRSAYSGNENLDVLFADQILSAMPNVLITPHIAFNTREAVGRLINTSVDNILSFLQGEPRNIVGK
jgi:D-lactate dehydrogenase